ncbi:MAG: 50S ribosomal protein L21 [Acidimicrobiaceae bacterium]|nr:50S ribosomal protein L21 [Acidimicrobiaceae bacterium]|tara:strand:- start:59 stop:370 length:312 start_codon:yes stop_codon:yes gene_type:complete
MYAVVKTGGKQYRVEENQVLQVELLGQIGDSVDLTPVMLVDGSTVLAKPSELKNVKINAEIVDKGKGKKITGFTYKNKSNQRRRWGHRQNFNEIKITSISRKN